MPFLERDLRGFLETAETKTQNAEHTEAAALLLRVIFLRENDDPRLACELYVKLAAARAAAGQTDKAHSALDVALKLVGDNHLYAAWVLSESAAIYEADGAYVSAGNTLKTAVWRLNSIEEPTLETKALIATSNARTSALKQLSEKDASNGYPLAAGAGV
jgi:ATP/maltotriose-dependent transcriptional regulator MalT